VLALARVYPGQFIELGDLSGNLDRKGRRIETGDALDARLAIENGAAEIDAADAVRTDYTKAGDDDARGPVLCDCRVNSFPAGMRSLLQPRASAIILQNAIGSVHLGPILPHEVQLL